MRINVQDAAVVMLKRKSFAGSWELNCSVFAVNFDVGM